MSSSSAPAVAEATPEQMEKLLNVPALKKMLAIGMAAGVIRQKLAVHVQTEPESDVVAKAVEELAQAGSVGEEDLSALYSLFLTKHQRTAVTRKQKEEFLGFPVMKKMLAVGHSETVACQRLATFLQVPTETAVVVRTVTALAANEPIAAEDITEMVELAASKYARMQARGAAPEKVERVRMWESHSVKHIDLILGNVTARGLTTLADTPSHLPRHVNTVDASVGDYGVTGSGASAKSIARTVETQVAAQEERRRSLREAIGYVEQKSASTGVNRADAIAAPVKGLAPANVAAPEVIESTEPFVHPLTGLAATGKTHVSGKIYSVSPIVTEDLCKDLVTRLAFSDDEVALHKVTAATVEKCAVRVVDKAIRRSILDADVAGLVWKAAKKVLPQRLDYGLVLDGIRTQMSFDCYQVGDSCDTHTDGGHRMAVSGDISMFSFLLHLNSDYEGGEVQFCDVAQWSGEGSATNETSRQASYAAGQLTLMSHDTVYRVAPVTSGSKYVIKGMAMYRHTRVSGRKDPARFRALARAF